MKKILLYSGLFLSFFGQAQTLDTTFNNSGILTSLFSNTKSSESIIHSEMQADGKMVYLGNYYENNSISGGLAGAFIARYNTDGSLDPTFNSCGFRIFTNDNTGTFLISVPTSSFNDIKIQSDGKIVVTNNTYVLRFNSDGSNDNSFGTNGHVQVTYNNSKLHFGTIRIQPDNKIVLNNKSSNTTLVRINSDGSLDTSFDNDGILVLNFGSPFGEEIKDIAVQPDGKLIAAVVTFSFANNYRLITVRLNNNGTKDSSFGTSGSTTPLSVLSYSSNSYVELQADGKILVMGPFSSNYTIARYNTNGTLDATFDTDGIKNISNSSFTGGIKSIKSLPDGKMIVLVTGTATISNNNTDPVFKIFKLNNDGSLDTTFGTNGQFYSATLYSDSNSINLKSDGSLTLNGSFIDYTNYINTTNLLHRLITINLSANGVINNSPIYNLKQNLNEFNGVIEQANGKIIAFYNSNKLFRYNLDGVIDTTFGTNGFIDLSGTYSNKIVQQPDGNFLLYNTNSSTIYRRNSSGILDTTFGTNGTLTITDIGSINKICVTNDNKLFILCTKYSYDLFKLNNNGTTDTSFTADTSVAGRINFYDSSEGETSENMIIQSDNKIIVALTLIGSNNYSVATGFIRFNPNGALDTTFGTSGKVIVQDNAYISPKKMFLLENDSFAVNYMIGTGESKLVKYNTIGSIDPSFTDNSIQNDLYNNSDIITQPDFKIIKTNNSSNKFSMSRFDNITGTLDTTFGTNGIINTSIGLGANINQLSWLQNNSLLASGTTFDGTNESIALARYVNLNLGTLTFTNQNAQSLIYPNPIQEEATFEYSLQNNENVSIEIIDMQGRIVQTILKNKELPQGNYKQNINVSSLVSSGNYILKFSSSKGNESIKIIKK